jgi:hypothetical protein
MTHQTTNLLLPSQQQYPVRDLNPCYWRVAAGAGHPEFA